MPLDTRYELDNFLTASQQETLATGQLNDVCAVIADLESQFTPKALEGIYYADIEPPVVVPKAIPALHLGVFSVSNSVKI